MTTMTHPSDSPVTIRLDLARAIMAHLGTRPYAEVAVVANALGGVLWELDRGRNAVDSVNDKPGQSDASSRPATGNSSDSGAKTTPSASPSEAPVPTHGPTDVPGVTSRPNGRLANA